MISGIAFDRSDPLSPLRTFAYDRFKIYTIVSIVRMELNSIQAIDVDSVDRVVCHHTGSVSIWSFRSSEHYLRRLAMARSGRSWRSCGNQALSSRSCVQSIVSVLFAKLHSRSDFLNRLRKNSNRSTKICSIRKVRKIVYPNALWTLYLFTTPKLFFMPTLLGIKTVLWKQVNNCLSLQRILDQNGPSILQQCTRYLDITSRFDYVLSGRDSRG